MKKKLNGYYVINVTILINQKIFLLILVTYYGYEIMVSIDSVGAATGKFFFNYTTTQENLTRHMELVHIQGQEMDEENSSIACQLCHRVNNEKINDEFIRFWEWYNKYLPA